MADEFSGRWQQESSHGRERDGINNNPSQSHQQQQGVPGNNNVREHNPSAVISAPHPQQLQMQQQQQQPSQEQQRLLELLALLLQQRGVGDNSSIQPQSLAPYPAAASLQNNPAENNRALDPIRNMSLSMAQNLSAPAAGSGSSMGGDVGSVIVPSFPLTVAGGSSVSSNGGTNTNSVDSTTSAARSEENLLTSIQSLFRPPPPPMNAAAAAQAAQQTQTQVQQLELQLQLLNSIAATQNLMGQQQESAANQPASSQPQPHSSSSHPGEIDSSLVLSQFFARLPSVPPSHPPPPGANFENPTATVAVQGSSSSAATTTSTQSNQNPSAGGEGTVTQDRQQSSAGTAAGDQQQDQQRQQGRWITVPSINQGQMCIVQQATLEDLEAEDNLRDNEKERFPHKLYRLLEEVEQAGRADVISFTASGKGFMIHKPEEFMNEIASKYFRQTKLKSFKRQLNLYGFMQCPFGPERGAYVHMHQYFERGRPDLLPRIQRT